MASTRTETAPRIVIASVLKPVDDPRALHRMGITLSQANKYDLHIIGFPAKKVPEVPGITFHPLPTFKRLSWQRMLAPFRLWQKCLQLKPQLLIINTHEYLIVSGLIRTFFGCKIVYDIRENYFRNLVYTHTYPIGIRHLLAIYVRLKEWVSKTWIHHYFLAEKGYQKEFSFHKPHFTILQNTFQGAITNYISKKRPEPVLEMVFTGTLAEHYGVFEAIKFTNFISKHIPTHLTLIGYAPDTSLLANVRDKIKFNHSITLVGGDNFVPHKHILEAIRQANVGIVAYPRHPATENCLPTRIYEYMAHELPFFMSPLPYWEQVCAPYKAAIPFSFSNFDSSDVEKALKALQNGDFYPKGAPKEAFWAAHDGPKLLQAIQELINP